MTLCKNNSGKFNVYQTFLPRRYKQFSAQTSFEGVNYNLGYFNECSKAGYYADLAIMYKASSINVVTNETNQIKKNEMLQFSKTFKSFYELKQYCYSMSDNELTKDEIVTNRRNGLYDKPKGLTK